MFRSANQVLTGNPTIVYNIVTKANVTPTNTTYVTYKLFHAFLSAHYASVLDETAKYIPRGFSSNFDDSAVWDKLVRATYPLASASANFFIRYDLTSLWNTLSGDPYQLNHFLTLATAMNNAISTYIADMVQFVQAINNSLVEFVQTLAYNVLDAFVYATNISTTVSVGGNLETVPLQPFAGILYRPITPNQSVPLLVPVGILLGFAPPPNVVGTTQGGSNNPPLNSYVITFAFYFAPWAYTLTGGPSLAQYWQFGASNPVTGKSAITFVDIVYYGLGNQYSQYASQLESWLYTQQWYFLWEYSEYLSMPTPTPPVNAGTYTGANTVTGVSSVLQMLYLVFQNLIGSRYLLVPQNPYSSGTINAGYLPSRDGYVAVPNYGNINGFTVSPTLVTTAVQTNTTPTWIGGGNAYILVFPFFIATAVGHEGQGKVSVTIDSNGYPSYISWAKVRNAFGLGVLSLFYVHTGANFWFALNQGVNQGVNATNVVNNYLLQWTTNQFRIYAPDAPDTIGDALLEVMSIIITNNQNITYGSQPVTWSGDVMITGNLKTIPAMTVNSQLYYAMVIDVADGTKSPSLKAVFANSEITPGNVLQFVTVGTVNTASYLVSDAYAVNGDFRYGPIPNSLISTKLNANSYFLNVNNPTVVNQGVASLDVIALDQNYNVLTQGTQEATVNETITYYPQNVLGYYTATGWVYVTTLSTQVISGQKPKSSNAPALLASLLLLALGYAGQKS